VMEQLVAVDRIGVGERRAHRTLRSGIPCTARRTALVSIYGFHSSGKQTWIVHGAKLPTIRHSRSAAHLRLAPARSANHASHHIPFNKHRKQLL
jgi:hypothetical protein